MNSDADDQSNTISDSVINRLKYLKSESQISEKNKELIRHFVFENYNKYDEAAIHSYIRSLAATAAWLEVRDLNDLDVGEINRLFNFYDSRNSQGGAVDIDEHSLIDFFNWLDKPVLAENLKNRNLNHYKKNEWLTEPEVYELLENIGTLQSKACVELLWLTGYPVGVIIVLDPTDIDLREYTSDKQTEMFQVQFPSEKVKDMERISSMRDQEIRVVQAPYFTKWYSQLGEEAEFLWESPKSGSSLHPETLRYHLKRAKERTGIDKPVTPKRIQQSRAIYLVRHGFIPTKESLREWFGWSQKSRTATKYWEEGIRLAEEDHNNLKYCITCEAAFSMDRDECYRCGAPNHYQEGLDEFRGKNYREIREVLEERISNYREIREELEERISGMQGNNQDE